MAHKPNKKKNTDLRDAVSRFIESQKSATFNYRQVSAALGIGSISQQRVIALYLAELAFDGDLIETAPGKYKAPSRTLTAEGVFSRRANGKNSVITDAELPITQRAYTGIYEYCKMCGACCRCPAHAISLEQGKSHHLCTSYFDTLREKYAPRFGCGKCYVEVPCMRHRP